MFDEIIKAIKAKIEEAQANANAFVKLAQSEKRDLTEEENASIDKIVDETIPALKANLERNEKLAAFSTDSDHSDEICELVDTENLSQRVTVPAQARRHAKLEAFKGENAEENAYSAGRWLMSTIGKDEQSAEWCVEHGIGVERGAMSTTDNQLGGFTVPTEMEVSIIALRDAHGVFRRNAMNEPMSSDVKSISRPTGGIEAHFVGEGEAGTESDSNWKNIELVARKLMALTRMSKEISADSVVSIADQVARDVAFAFAKKEDQCGFLGDGTASYGDITGLVNAIQATSKYTALAGNTAFSTLDLEDFEGMVGQLPDYAEAGAKWYISKKGYSASMLNLINAAGGNTRTDITGAPIKEFLGFPVEIVQVMNSTTTAQTSTNGLCYLGDLSMAATLANRTGMSLDVSEHVHFTTDQIAIKGTERFGINIHEVGAATGDAGPLLMLSTPGA